MSLPRMYCIIMEKNKKQQYGAGGNEACDGAEENAFAHWEQEFRRAARADRCVLLRNQLRALELPEDPEPEPLLEGTIQLVLACCAYSALDGRSFADFLGLQNYYPQERSADPAGGAAYVYTVDLCGKAFARILVPANVRFFDLADLFNHPWQPFKVCGYYRFWISRVDGEELTDEERAALAQEVTDDLYFDYSENELAVWCAERETSPPGTMLVEVQDILDPEPEEDEEPEAEPKSINS